MRKLLLLFSVIFGLSISSRLMAQNQIGGYIYPILAYTTNTPTDDYYKSRLGLSYGLGAEYIYFFDKKYSNRLIGGRLANEVRARHALRFGLHYQAINLTWKGNYIDPNGKDVEHHGSKRLRLIKLPVTWQYTIPFNYRVKMKFFTGPQFGYLVWAQGGLVHYNAQTGYFDLPRYSNKERGKYFNKVTVDWIAALGIYLHVTRWWNAVALVRGEYSITNVEKKAEFTVENSSPERKGGIYRDDYKPKTHSLNLGFMVGAEYRFHKAAHSRTKF